MANFTRVTPIRDRAPGRLDDSQTLHVSNLVWVSWSAAARFQIFANRRCCHSRLFGALMRPWNFRKWHAALAKPEVHGPGLSVPNWVNSGRLSSWPRLWGFYAPGIALNPLGAVHSHIDVAGVINGYGLAPLPGAGGLAI